MKQFAPFLLFSRSFKRNIFLLISICSICFSFSVPPIFAAEYSQLFIEPQHVGVFYNWPQQFHCYGKDGSGEWVDITDEVDWYVEERPLNHLQTTPANEIVTIDETGYATVVEGQTWGRVNISACYPKGCNPTIVVPELAGLAAGLNVLLKVNFYTLSLDITGTGIVVDKTGEAGAIDCNSVDSETCNAEYSEGSYVTLKATTPERGHTAGLWSGACGTGATTTDCTVTMDSDKSAGATFAALDPYTVKLNVTSIGDGTGGLISANLDPILTCGSTSSPCSGTYYDGESVTFSATEVAGYKIGWSENCEITGGGLNCTIDVNASTDTDGDTLITVTATYTAQHILTVTEATGGNISSIPVGIDCGDGQSDCTETFNHNQNVTLSATPGNGYTDGTWTGACAATESTGTDCIVTMDAAKTVSATFTTLLTVTPPAGGNISSDPAGIDCGTGADCTEIYDVNQNVTLYAFPGIGYTGTWTGDCGTGPTTANCVLIMNSAKTAGAIFTGP